MNAVSRSSAYSRENLKISALTSEGLHPERKEKSTRNMLIKRILNGRGRKKRENEIIDESIDRCIPESASTCISPASAASSERLKNPLSP